MELKLSKDLIRYIDYGACRIYLCKKGITEKAFEFHLLSPNKKMSKEKIWIAKSVLEGKRDGYEYCGLAWIFDDDKNREKLEKVGYRL